ncbi:MAG TPA: amidohydrolase family protein [Steroidobacteraceae bacterium]|nr:amidohydrolase family protein [Steroidobacteraceae bacterium]
MLRHTLFGGLLAALVSTAFAQTPVDQLAKPPANATHYIIQSTGGKHGDSWLWTTADGTRMARESFNLRGQVFEFDATGKPGKDGMPANMVIRGQTPQGDAGETFDIANGKAAWKSPVDAGSADYKLPAFYATQGGPVDNLAWFVERILASPDKSLAVLPGGKAHADKLTTVTVGKGADAKPVTAWAISGLNNSPVPVWADSNGKFFGFVFFLSWLPEQYASEHVHLNDAQSKAMADRMPALAKSLVKAPAGPVAFMNVRVFDAEAKRFLEEQTVLIDQGKISAVGASATMRLAGNVQIIEGRGKTLVPGLWDCHMHVANDFTGLQELSMGVTSIRDPGNDDSLTIDRRERSKKGGLLMPNVYPSSLIDGKGPYTAQVANVATSQAEAIALVDKAKEKGFTGVKFYGTLNKDWLPAAAAEAHKQGLHVHGHIPVGMRPLDAINAGYDEVTHINWIVMQAMPDDVINASNGIMRFEGPGRYAKDLDLGGKPIMDIIATMAKKNIYSDPTMVAFEGLYVPENGDLSPAYSPFVGTLPVTVERGFRTGGFAVPKDLTRADYRASWAKMVQLLGRMHKAGVPIVAGTDGAGIELVRELEIYVEAGMTPAEALATATLAPAKLVGQDATTGSIKAGKVADLVLVDGDPSKRIGDLRQTRVVMLGGKLLDADALRTAAGYSGRPRRAN